MKEYTPARDDAALLDKLTEIVEAIPAGIIAYRPDGHVVFANPEAGRILQVSPLSLLGQSFNDPRWQAAKIDGTPLADEDYSFSVAMRTGRSVDDVHQVIELSSGARAILQINAAPFKGSSGEIETVVQSFLDVTQAKGEETKQRRAKELSNSLNDLSAVITSTLDFNKVVQKVAVEVAETLGTESYAVLVRETDGWVARHVSGRVQAPEGTRLTDDQAKVSVMASITGKPVVIEEVHRDDLVDPDTIRQYELQSVLVVPLLAQGEVFGTMCFMHHSAPTSFSEAELDWATKLGTLLSLAFKNTQLYSNERQTSQKLQEAQRMTGFGTWEWDVASNSTKWSDELYRLHCVEPATFDPNDFEAVVNCIHPKDRERVAKVMEELREGDGPFEIEYRIMLPDAKVRWVHARGNIVCNELNKPINVRGITMDISESVRIEAALQDSEQRYRELAESADDSIFVINRDFRLDYVNMAGAKEHDGSPAELVGKPVSDLFPPHIFGKMESSLQETIESKRPFSMERLFTFPAGEKWLDTRLIPLLNDNGEVKAILGIARDITKRKRSEAALTESEEKYRKLMNLANDAIFVADAETGILVEANQKGSQLVGRPLSEIIGMHQSKLHPPDKAEDYRDIFREYVAKGQGVTVELLVRHADGRDIPVEISSSVLKLGETVLTKGIFRDLTTRNRAKELSDALNDINSAINSSLDFEQIMKNVVSSSTEAIGSETAVVAIRDKGMWELRYIHGFAEDITGVRFTDEQSPHIILATESNKTVAINDAYNDDRVDVEVMKKYEVRSALVAPLLGKEEVIGALIFNYHSTQADFSALQIDFAEKLGASISLALENARLFSEQQRIAGTLQEALLVVPEELPHVEFGHLYRSSAKEAMVGGDFYDFFALQGDRVGVAIGDVSGKGLGAATLTSSLKQMIKSYAHEGHSPGAIISKTNAIMIKELEPSTFVTAFVGILDTRSGMLTYSCAGHPPPIIKRQNGDIDLLDVGGPPIGVLDFLEAPDKQQLIKEGDLVTLYTDGVIEARCASGMYGENRLIDVLRSTTPLSPAEVPQRIFDELIRCGCTLSDDLAIVSLSLKNNQ